MKKPLIVKDSIIILIISILCTLFFAACLVLSVASYLGKNDMESLILCALIFGGFTLPGLLLTVYCIRRRLVFYDNYAAYTPPFGRTRRFSYSEIRSVVQKREKFIIYGYDDRKLAVFENNMPAFYEALCLLDEKYVKIIPARSAYGERADIPYASSPDAASGMSARPAARKNKRLNLTDKDAYLRARYSAEAVGKQKRIIRAVHIALIILSLSAVFLPLKGRLSVYILTLLFPYFVFLFFYPRLTLEKAKNCDEYHIPFPMAACFISLLFSLRFVTTTNMEENTWIFASAVLLFILLIPCLVMLRLRRIKEHPLLLVGLAAALFFLSFFLLPVACYVTSGKPVHDTVIVLDKDSYRGSHTTSYDIIVVWRDKEQKMDVSSSLYKSVKPGDTVRVCVRKSLPGIEIWRVHR